MQFIRFLAVLVVLCLLAACKTAAPLDAYQGLSDQQIFQRAEQSLQKNRYEQAVKDLEALDTLYPFGQYSQQGQRAIIDAYYKNDDTDSALAAADRYIRLYPRADDVDYAYYQKAMINLGPKEGWYMKWVNAEPTERDVSAQQAALQDFTTLVERFPKSQYAPEAQRYILDIRTQLAQHELVIARYYFQRKTYVAAANRATKIVEEYPNNPQIPAALEIMVKSYRALNEPNIANNALGMLMNRYPDSPEAKKRL